MDNTLYQEWQRLHAGATRKYGMWYWDAEGVEERCQHLFNSYKAKEELQVRFAWSIPSPEAITRLAQLSPIVEIGAGRGYWAALLQEAGADVVCYDEKPPDTHEDNHWAPGGDPVIGRVIEPMVFTKVHKGGPEVVREHSDRALFLCWPPYDTSMAYDCITQYKGDTLIYVGEGEGGCTGDDAFHTFLDAHFKEIERIEIPTWGGIHDGISILKRKFRLHLV